MRIPSIVLAGVICVFAVCGSPSVAQEAKVEEDAVEKVQSKSSGNPKTTITTEDPTIPLDELKLLVKPLTLEELQNESEDWLLLLKDKVKEISDAEIAIKRQNQSIDKEKKAPDELESAKKALKAAESVKAGANPGSPEYEKATRELEPVDQLEKNAEADSKLKNQLVVTVTQLQSDRTAIVERFKAVLDELELKGGNPKSYRQYIEAINVVEVGIGGRFIGWLKSAEGGLLWAVNIGVFLGIVIASIIVSLILAIFLKRYLVRLIKSLKV